MKGNYTSPVGCGEARTASASEIDTELDVVSAEIMELLREVHS